MTSDNKFSHLKTQLRSRRIYEHPETGEPLPRQVRADQLHPHPLNPKYHPDKQHEVVAGSLDTLGQIDGLVINIRNGMIVDGHERAWLALGYSDDTLVDVDWVDLSEDEHELALAIYDETRAYAQYNRDDLEALLQRTNTDNAALQTMLSEMAVQQGIIPNDFDPMQEWVGMPEFEQDTIKPFHSLTLHFPTENDMQDFAELVGQTITDGTKYLYYPKQEQKGRLPYRVIDES